MKRLIIQVIIFSSIGFLFSFLYSPVLAQNIKDNYIECGWDDMMQTCGVTYDTCNPVYSADWQKCENQKTQPDCLANRGPHACLTKTQPTTPTQSTPPAITPPSTNPGTFTCGYDPYVGSGSCEVADAQCNTGFQPDMSLCSKNKDSGTCNSAGRINCVASNSKSSNYSGPQSIPGGDNVKCMDTMKNLKANPEVYDWNRNFGEADCNTPILQSPKLITRDLHKTWDISYLVSQILRGFFSFLVPWQADMSQAVVYKNGPDTTSSTEDYQNLEKREDWRTSLAGYCPTCTEKNIYQVSTNKLSNNNSDVLGIGSDNLIEIYNNSSVYDKLKPYECMDLDKKWRPCEIVDRENILAKILSGYKQSIFGSSGDLKPTHDYTYGYLGPKGIAALPKAINQDIAEADSNVLAVSTGDQYGGSISRPYYGIEIICINPKLKSPGVSDSQKAEICNKVVGGEFASGKISTDSILGKLFTQSEINLATPSLECIYEKSEGCGALYYGPVVAIEEDPGTMCEKGILGNYTSCSSISKPIQSVANILKDDEFNNKIGDIFATAYDHQKMKKDDFNTKGVGEKVTGTSASRVAADTYNNGANFTFGKSDVLGVTNKSGEVLGETFAVPEPEGNTGTITQTVKIGYDIYMSENAIKEANYWNFLRGVFSPPEISETFDKQVNGEKVKYFPLEESIKFSTTDTSASIADESGELPFLGGPLLSADILQGLIKPYCDPAEHSWCIQDNVGPKIRQLAKVQELEQLARAPWNKLLSIKESAQKENISSK